ncbi:PaaI family thioesterase [Mangrovibacillus cuniculi]|uniref:PaaI family thioesterase n=1 Tax=Mangrovibacillus cuniculi TaxID=2593652 RepID=A0A7S8CA56_9BACI|nr:PaaI family thioesterase [Mangrovibacillus cuniculi]QPC46225.1 PaaI family thioesterase [Mangrovibacillus cuniculi]
MSKEIVQDRFNKLIERANPSDLATIERLLKGIERQVEEPKQSWLSSLFDLHTDISEESLKMTIPISEITHNSLGILHGGMTTTLIDSAMGTMANKLAKEGFAAVTTQLNIHFTAPGIGKNVTADVHIIHHGQTTMVLGSSAKLENGKQIAYATASFAFIPKSW